MRFSASIFIFLCLIPNLSPACSVCGCGDPLLAAGSTQPMPGQLRLRLEGEYLYATAQSDDDPASTEFLAQETIKVIGAYAPSSSLMLVLQLPFVRKAWWTNDPAADLGSTSNEGLGDIDLGARWFFWSGMDMVQRRMQNLALSAGSSLPTGASDIRVDSERIDQHAQLGTGALGPYLGLLYGLNLGDWSLNANATWRYRATNAQGYQFGQALSFGLESQWHPVDAFALGLNLEGRYADYDHDWSQGDDALRRETGGTVLDLTPNLGWQLGQDLGLKARIQIPVCTNLFGTQSLSPTTDLSVQYLFNL
jgi:hypothetical protein